MLTRQAVRDYLNDALPDAELTAVEKLLRDDPAAKQLLDAVRAEEDRGDHTLGAVWRAERLSCPAREHLGGYLLQALDPDHEAYIRFHLTTVGCPFCQANLDDLKAKQAKADGTATKRRQRIIKSSAGVLPKP